MPSTAPSRVALVSIVVTSVLVVAYYNGNLKATITVPDTKPRYSVLADVIGDSSVKVYVNRGGANRDLMEVSKR